MNEDADAVKVTMDTVLWKNLRHEEIVMCGDSNEKIISADIVNLKYNPITPCSFIQYKSVLETTEKDFLCNTSCTIFIAGNKRLRFILFEFWLRSKTLYTSMKIVIFDNV